MEPKKTFLRKCFHSMRLIKREYSLIFVFKHNLPLERPKQSKYQSNNEYNEQPMQR